jgi:hypothetical protein
MSSLQNTKKMIDAKKMTITFTRTQEFVLDYDEWYANKKDEFNTEDDALKQWRAMCDGTEGKYEGEYGDYCWDDVQMECDEIQEEYNEMSYDDEMERVIDDMAEEFEEIGVEFLKNHSCCNTCGHSEAFSAGKKNYVFYHEQDNDRLRKGAREINLAFNFDDETKVKVLELVDKHYKKLHWCGEEHTKVYLTCDDDLMKEHTRTDEKRQAFLENKKKEEKEKEEASMKRVMEMVKERVDKEKGARREELLKQLAELDKI